jgi:hypothetical protein
MPQRARESTIREHIQEIASDAFPDDDVQWKVRGFHHSGDYSFVEVEPVPPTVGYPKFIFVLHFDGFGHMQDCGCYCWNGAWQLHSTSPGAPQDWKRISPVG